MQQHMKILGHKAKDKVTGLEGVVESISFDLYGCVQAVIRPDTLDKDGKTREGHWLDVKRLTITSDKPIMDVPDFGKPEIGAADKPMRN